MDAALHTAGRRKAMTMEKKTRLSRTRAIAETSMESSFVPLGTQAGKKRRGPVS
jgi:hypothetical protein